MEVSKTLRLHPIGRRSDVDRTGRSRWKAIIVCINLSNLPCPRCLPSFDITSILLCVCDVDSPKQSTCQYTTLHRRSRPTSHLFKVCFSRPSVKSSAAKCTHLLLACPPLPLYHLFIDRLITCREESSATGRLVVGGSFPCKK